MLHTGYMTDRDDYIAGFLDDMEQRIAAVPPAFYRNVPPPGYAHPYHQRHKRTIVDWLEGRAFEGCYDLCLPVMPVMRIGVIDPDAPMELPAPMKTLVMRRQRVYGAAPYVGRPFVYWWWCAVDDYGRGVGGEKTEIAYTDGDRRG